MSNPILVATSLTTAAHLKIKPKKKKKEGNETLTNWDYLPEALRLFYEEVELTGIYFRKTRYGTKIEIKKVTSRKYQKTEWMFGFNREDMKFGLYSEDEQVWVYGTNEEKVMM